MAMSRQREVLLTNGAFYGTLAAARLFGRQGYRVTIADPKRYHATGYSRFVARNLVCPAALNARALIDWLVEYGQKHPGTLLYPCSDDHAWIFAQFQEQLAPHFLTCQPKFTTIETLLDKQQLYQLCESIAVPVPRTFYPANQGELQELSESLTGDFLIKPKTQVGMKVNKKALRTRSGASLVSAYGAFQQQFNYCGHVAGHSELLNWPMVQAFHRQAATATVSVAGFCSRDGQSFYASASRKCLQYPLNIGVGLCFEALPEHPELCARAQKLCQASGYFGVFEAEFIAVDGEYLLMDFNPRFYGQMQLEIARGLPLPKMLDALARRESPVLPSEIRNNIFLGHRALLRMLSLTQWMGKRISWQERRRWLSLGRSRDHRWVDQAFDHEDRLPWLVDSLRRALKYLRHPRSSMRELFGDA